MASESIPFWLTQRWWPKARRAKVTAKANAQHATCVGASNRAPSRPLIQRAVIAGSPTLLSFSRYACCLTLVATPHPYAHAFASVARVPPTLVHRFLVGHVRGRRHGHRRRRSNTVIPTHHQACARVCACACMRVVEPCRFLPKRLLALMLFCCGTQSALLCGLQREPLW